MLQLQHVSKQYQKRDQRIDALLPTDLSVSPGEFVAIVGPSGSGKTTLLSILGGMLTPTTGHVLFKGVDLYQLNASERSQLRNESIGFVFQNFNLVPWLTAIENVQLPLTILGTEPRVQQTRAEEMLARFGLSDRAHHKPSELSAGQQQRVALARTLVMSPQLILADEPTGNLDPAARQIVLDTLWDCCQSAQQTVIVVTHDPSIAASANRTVSIHAGRLQVDTTDPLAAAS